MARAGEPIERRLFRGAWRTKAGCLEFAGSRALAGGHGQIHYAGRNRSAHSVAWELEHGPLSAGQQVNHHCDNPPCIELAHLYVGSQRQNLQDMNLRDRNVRGETVGNHKLTTEQVLAIYEATGSHQGLAEQFDVSRSAVDNIKAGVSWRSVTGQEFSRRPVGSLLSEEQIDRACADPRPSHLVASELGVSARTVRSVRQQRRGK